VEEVIQYENLDVSELANDATTNDATTSAATVAPTTPPLTAASPHALA
jgi:hypothetical protein